MRILLVGSDLEENLGLGILAACAQRAGHDVRIAPFDDESGTARVVDEARAWRPGLIGLGIQFQHRAADFLALARRLRAAGCRAHITAGGQFPTMAHRELIEGRYGVDSIVLHEGEQTLVELADALERGAPLAEVDGLALPDAGGAAALTRARPLAADLDTLPFAYRYREHARHVGIPFIPMIGSRGCWGSCSYCSISTFYRDARARGGGRLLRARSPHDVAAEMALLWHRAGGAAVFCFHDDNFLLPRPADSLARLRAIRGELDDYGVGRVGLIGKCRPETLTPELARELAALGVIRLYVGVENASAAGSAHLRRGRQHEAIADALRSCRQAGIFVCYNLLLFEPEARLDDVRENVAFMRAHADHPVNFCRAEPYHGTLLHRAVSGAQELGGSHLGWNYRIADDRAELLFRICAAAFRERNFARNGVANRTMGLGYAAKIVEHFELGGDRAAALAERARRLTRGISLDSADLLAKAIDLAATAPLDARDAIARHTALLGLEVAAADRIWHAELDALYRDLDAAGDARPDAPRRPRPLHGKLLELARNVALGVSLSAAAQGCDDSMTVDPVPPDASADALVADPLPYDAAMPDALVADPAPYDAATPDGMVADPPPADEPRADEPRLDDGPKSGAHRPDGQWSDSAPARAPRTPDLPLHDPPKVTLRAERSGDAVVVHAIVDAASAVTTRWQSDGALSATGTTARWRPSGDDDQIRVAVRSRGGIAVVALRAAELPAR